MTTTLEPLKTQKKTTTIIEVAEPKLPKNKIKNENELFEDGSVRKTVWQNNEAIAWYELDLTSLPNSKNLNKEVIEYVERVHGIYAVSSLGFRISDFITEYIIYADDKDAYHKLKWVRVSFDSGDPLCLEVGDGKINKTHDLILGNYTPDQIWDAYLKFVHFAQNGFTKLEEWEEKGIPIILEYNNSLKLKEENVSPFFNCGERTLEMLLTFLEN